MKDGGGGDDDDDNDEDDGCIDDDDSDGDDSGDKNKSKFMNTLKFPKDNRREGSSHKALPCLVLKRYNKHEDIIKHTCL